MSGLPPKLVRIFISSPSDVAEERRAAAELIERELAKREAFRAPLKLDVFRYDDPNSDTPFLADRSAQASVDQRLQSAEAEIVIAILWARMGTPVRDPDDPGKILYQSGTEQEIKEALKAGREVLVYFRRGQPPAPDDDEDLEKFKEQRKKVRAFRDELRQQGRGANEYQDVEHFKRKLAQHLDQLLTRIRDASLPPARQVATVPEPPHWSSDPYPGLRSFEPEEAPIFFGRNDETAELVRWVVEEGRHFVAVVGVSGSGKSSLVKAGLVPVLPEWLCVIVRLTDAGGDPFRALAMRLGPLLPPPRRAAFRSDPAKRLAERGWIDELLAEKPASACLLIFIDQFEELQTAVPENLRAGFAELLGELVNRDRVRVVVSLRADLLGAMSRDETLARLLRGQSFVLHPPGASALRAIIREPARLVGVAVEDQLINELAEAARAEPGALPLLAFALERIYDRGGRRLVRPNVAGSTTLGAILEDYTKKVEDELGPNQCEALPRLFRHLVRVDDGGRRVAKRRCHAADIGEDATLTALRDRLIEDRLLTALDDAAEGVELAHEVLLQAWPSLRKWVGASSRHLVVRDDVERLRAAGAPRLEGWLLERALDLEDEAPELLDEAQVALVRRSGEEYRDFLRREANAVAERAASCITEGDSATAIALCLEVLPSTPRSRRPATALALSTLYEGWRSLRELRVLETGQGAVLTVSFSLDGTRVVSAGEDSMVRLWPADGTGEPLILRGHEGKVFTASFSPDGRRVVTAGEDGTVRLWSAEGTGEPLIVSGHDGWVYAASFDRDGTRVVSAGWDGMVRVWRADGTGVPLVLRGHEREVWAASFSPDGMQVVSAGNDRTVRLWGADGSSEPLVLRGHERPVRAASFSRNQTCVVGAGDDGTVLQWSLRDPGKPQILIRRQDAVAAASFSPEGTRLVSACNDGAVRLWRADRPAEPLIFRGHEGEVWAASFSPDGALVVSAGEDGTVRLWHAEGQLWRAGGARGPRIFEGHEGWVYAATFNPDGTLVASAGRDGTVRLWHAEGTGEPLVLRHEGWVFAASFSPDGMLVVSAGSDGTARLWRSDGSGTPLVLRGHAGGLVTASFSPDGKLVVSAGRDRTVRVWHASGEGQPLILTGHEEAVYAASFSPDGTRVVSAGEDGTVRLWRIDGAGEPLILGRHDGWVFAASFSPDGTLVVSAGGDGTVRLWRADGSGEPQILGGDKGAVLAASFSPDGTRVVSAGTDGAVRVRHADGAGDPLILRGHEGGVHAVSFSSDGTRVVSAGEDGTVLIWHVFASEHALIEAARAVLPRQLTDTQRAKYHLPPRSV
jgi:WD40 repeat protein